MQFLKDRSFKFLVASKSVGFEVYNAGRISEKDFELVFNLWCNGGPLWHREEAQFYHEQDAEWSLVGWHGRVVRNMEESPPAQPSMLIMTPLNGEFYDQNIQSSAVSGQSDRRSPGHLQILCHACGMLGHRARFCPEPRLTGLLPFFSFPSFPSPPKEAWAEGIVNGWFRAQGPAPRVKLASSFSELISGLFANF